MPERCEGCGGEADWLIVSGPGAAKGYAPPLYFDPTTTDLSTTTRRLCNPCSELEWVEMWATLPGFLWD